jgi:hypothetical protein
MRHLRRGVALAGGCILGDSPLDGRQAGGRERHVDRPDRFGHARLSAYLGKTFGLSDRASDEAAQRLLGQLLYPRFLRALFGMDKLATSLNTDVLAPDLDLKPIRKAVAGLIESLPERQAEAGGKPHA